MTGGKPLQADVSAHRLRAARAVRLEMAGDWRQAARQWQTVGNRAPLALWRSFARTRADYCRSRILTRQGPDKKETV